MQGKMKAAATAVLGLALGFTASAQQKKSTDDKAENSRLVLQAQGKYQSLMGKARDAYSDTLLQQERTINAYARRNAIDLHDKVVFLDPMQADVGRALGLPDHMVVQTMLLEQGVTPYETFTDMLGSFLFTPTGTEEGDGDYTQNPHALFVYLPGGEKSACVIVPAPENNIPAALSIRGLNAEDAAKFSNAHEGWHCLDAVYYHDPTPAKMLAGIDPKTPSRLLGNPAALAAYSTLNKAEAFADVAAAGDALRRGEDLTFVDKIIAWRRASAGTLVHATAPVLAHFRDEIDHMGVPAFRGISETDARALYYKMVEEHALNPARLAFKLRFDASDEEAQTRLASDAERNGVREALDFNVTKPADDFSAAFTAILGGQGQSATELVASKAVQNSLEHWDAMQALRAACDRDDISPAGLTRAYIRLQRQFQHTAKDHPAEAKTYQAMATRLKQEFTSGLVSFDYAELRRQSTPAHP